MYTFVQQIQSWYIEKIKPIKPYISSRYEYSRMKRYIKEYETEIKKISFQLQNDPNNQELKAQLQDKIKRKQQFEEDIKAIYFDKEGNRIN